MGGSRPYNNGPALISGPSSDASASSRTSPRTARDSRRPRRPNRGGAPQSQSPAAYRILAGDHHHYGPWARYRGRVATGDTAVWKKTPAPVQMSAFVVAVDFLRNLSEDGVHASVPISTLPSRPVQSLPVSPTLNPQGEPQDEPERRRPPPPGVPVGAASPPRDTRACARYDDHGHDADTPRPCGLGTFGLPRHAPRRPRRPVHSRLDPRTRSCLRMYMPSSQTPPTLFPAKTLN